MAPENEQNEHTAEDDTKWQNDTMSDVEVKDEAKAPKTNAHAAHDAQAMQRNMATQRTQTLHRVQATQATRAEHLKHAMQAMQPVHASQAMHAILLLLSGSTSKPVRTSSMTFAETGIGVE